MRRPDEVANPAPLSLRQMVLGDLDEVMTIERKAFKHPWSAELFAKELEHDWSTVLVAQLGEDPHASIAGFIIYWFVHDEIHILNVATDPARRRQGIARRLLEECVARGRVRGQQLATLEVRRSNQAAINLYQAFGFRSVGVRANYYADEGEDAIVMLLDLAAAPVKPADP